MEFNDKFNRKITLSDERWKHITETHPELIDKLDVLKKTLEEPELIKRSVYDEKVILIYKYYEHIYNGKYMCVVVTLDNGLVVTAYITDKIKKGEIIWTKN